MLPTPIYRVLIWIRPIRRLTRRMSLFIVKYLNRLVGGYGTTSIDGIRKRIGNPAIGPTSGITGGIRDRMSRLTRRCSPGRWRDGRSGALYVYFFRSPAVILMECRDVRETKDTKRTRCGKGFGAPLKTLRTTGSRATERLHGVSTAIFLGLGAQRGREMVTMGTVMGTMGRERRINGA